MDRPWMAEMAGTKARVVVRERAAAAAETPADKLLVGKLLAANRRAADSRPEGKVPEEVARAVRTPAGQALVAKVRVAAGDRGPAALRCARWATSTRETAANRS